MDVLNIVYPYEFKFFLLILIRVSIIIFLFPIFSSQLIPTLVKSSLALVIGVLLFSHVYVDIDRFPSHLAVGIILFVSEILLGLTIALVVRTFFASVQFAGQLIGFQMGFSMVNVIDPQSGTNVSIFEQFSHWVVLLVFLFLNGHHILFYSLINSFDLIPIGFLFIKGAFIQKITLLMTNVFVMGFKIAAPAACALFLTNVCFGVTSKFIPQMNVMFISFPISIMMGFSFFIISLEIILVTTKPFIVNSYREIISLIGWLAGG